MSLEELQQHYQKETDSRTQDRILMLIHVKQWHSTQKVVKMANLVKVAKSRNQSILWVAGSNRGAMKRMKSVASVG
ncbi:MAG: hypothetical protein ACFFC7_28485 [Candidatus Hermodarchaeota archaeon]